MNFEIIKIGFKVYLEEKGKIDKDDNSVIGSNINLFTYADDFKEYLGNKLSGNTSDIKSKSISDILKMEITKDGKLVNPKEKTTSENTDSKTPEKHVDEEELAAYDKALEDTNTDTNTVNNDEAGILKDSETGKTSNIKNDMFTDVFNELLKDDKFKKAIDTDSSGDIKAEELENFVNAIKDLDKDDKDVSVEDLLVAAERINNDVFKVPKSEKELTKKDIAGIKKDVKDKKPSSSKRLPSRSNVGGSGGGGRTGGSSKSSRGSYNPNVSAKTPKTMSESELQTELKKANDELIEKQNVLSKIVDGSDEKIKELETNVVNSYNAYQELLKTVDIDMAKQVDDLQTKINEKEKAIKDKDAAIVKKESTISAAENSYNSAKSNRENLESILKELQSSNSKDNDLSSKISEVNSQLASAQQAENSAKESLEKEKKELEKLKEEKKELETGDSGLNKLNEEMTKLKNDIVAKHSEVKELQDTWDKAKSTLETEKSTAVSNAKTEVNKAQDNVNKIQNAITEYKNNETKGQYSNQYNETAGNKIASQAQNVAGTVGRCLAGVAQNLEAIYGTFPDIYSAYQAADYLASDSGIGAHFKEVQVAREDLPNLPAGAVVVWDNNENGGGSNVSAAGKVHGHISIALGDGRESSDHIQEQIVNRDATFRVFYPVS